MKIRSFNSFVIWAFAALAVGACGAARGQWMEGHWQFRRGVDVDWDSDHAVGRELATADIFTAGHETDGGDVRVVSQGGGIVASHILGVGPGDVVHLVFELAPGQTHYFVYFDNPAPPPRPAGTEDVQYRSGILIQMKQWSGARPHDASDVEDQWTSGGPIMGQTFIPQPFYTQDPLGNQARRIYKLTGSLAVPETRDYFFCGSAEGFATLYLDDNLVLSIPTTAKDTRYHALVKLAAGRHNFMMYYVRPAQNEILALDWRRPDTSKLEAVPRTAFGVIAHGEAGALEEYGKPLVGDFEVQYQGECPLDDNNYSHRYHFAARVPTGVTEQVRAGLKFDWDFGDGITSGGMSMDHVYVTPGIYPVKITVRSEGSSDTQTTRLWVDRDYSALAPPQDTMLRQGRIVAGYDVAQVPEPWLAWMVLLERGAQATSAEMSAAARMVALTQHGHPDICLSSLKQIAEDLTKAGNVEQAANMWDHVPAHSDLEPQAAIEETNELIWWVGDFPRALKAMERIGDTADPEAQRVHAEALVLNNRAADGEKILTQLQEAQEKIGVRLAAVSGAMARTIEYRVDQKDWQTGEEEWETWQSRCPLAFLEGYSILLRSDLMEDRGAVAAAAKVDEAFAQAEPNSPYAPHLLDEASTLLAKIDPAKSKQLRDLLKSQYPEDPLSQKN